MATDHIRYDLLVQNAFREIFRKVLTEVAAKGLPGDHHFLITFRTGAPGVKLSDRLRQQHPHDMTIVLQHQFWDLAVSENGFSVGLSFKHVPEKLVVPFSAVTGFFDPSVNFGAEFTAEAGEEESAAPKPLAIPSPKGRLRGSGSEPAEAVASAQENNGEAGSPERAAAGDDGPARSDSAGPAPAEGPKVVSIDAFRKKT
jgi:hypothetical protein